MLQTPVSELLKMDPGPGGMTKNISARIDCKGVPIARRKDGVLTGDITYEDEFYKSVVQGAGRFKGKTLRGHGGEWRIFR